VINDLGSTNGTFLNGERLTGDRRINDGDIITVGSVSLRFEAS
jgi:pSer/pThr/pTyr-binding forkhead associated (FHA) protein